MKTRQCNNRRLQMLSGWIVIGLVISALARPAAALTRIRDIARPLGQRNNYLHGWGLVVGVNGKGDGGDLPFVSRSLMTALQRMGNPADLKDFKNIKNVAFVMLRAQIPDNGVRNGDRIDVELACVGKASNLEGGMLLMSPLMSSNQADATIYAWAAGNVAVPDQTNKTTGIIKGGAIMEVDFMHDYVDQTPDGRTYFDLILNADQANWQVANQVSLAIDDMNFDVNALASQGQGPAGSQAERITEVISPRTIRVYIPGVRAQRPASFITQVMSQVLELPDPIATIVINEKSGTIAITGNVEIDPCLVTVAGLMIRVGSNAGGQAAQAAPAGQAGPAGQPAATRQSQWLKFDTSKAGTAKLDDLITALDQLNVDIKQKINALLELHATGALHARVIVK